MREVQAGRIRGPLKEKPYPVASCNPLGLVPKKDDLGNDLSLVNPEEESSWQLITHLSYPRGASVNSNIPKENCTVNYTMFDQAVEMVASQGVGAYMAKVDLKSAFRQIPIHPLDHPLLCMYVQKYYFVDQCLPFGLASSCKIFEAFSSAFEWIIRQNITSLQILHYLDDFFSCKATKIACNYQVQVVHRVAQQLGIPIADDKTVWATTALTFLGLGVDSVNQRIYIPPVKLQRLLEKLAMIINGKNPTARVISSLAGSLSFYCRAVPPGRPFIRRLYGAIAGMPLYHHVTMTGQMRRDLKVWWAFLSVTEVSSSKHFMSFDPAPSQVSGLSTDALSEVGFGCYFRGAWCQARWDHDLMRTLNLGIVWEELFAVLVAITIWGSQLQNQTILVDCDNLPVVYMVNDLTTRSTTCMPLVRLLTFQMLRHNLVVKARHLSSEENSVADALSRFDESTFFQLVGQEADVLLVSLPESPRPISKTILDNWRQLHGQNRLMRYIKQPGIGIRFCLTSFLSSWPVSMTPVIAYCTWFHSWPWLDFRTKL